MIFAREVNDHLTGLVKKIDAANAKNQDCDMGSFVVFLSDDKGLEKQLKELAKKEQLKHTVLTIDKPAGPRGYDISPDADVTVILYTKRNVKANFAFRKGELKDADVEKITAALPKILPESK